MKRGSLAALIPLVIATPVFAQASAPWGTYEGHTVVRVMINGSEVRTSVPAMIYDDRTLVPIRLLEATGAKVEWDDSTKTVLVHTAYTYGDWDEPVNGQSVICLSVKAGAYYADPNKHNGDEDSKLASLVYGLSHFPYDADVRPTADALAEWATVLREAKHLNDEATANPSDMTSFEKMRAAVVLTIVAADMYNRLMSEYADQHDGKDVCGDTFEPLPVDWSQVH